VTIRDALVAYFKARDMSLFEIDERTMSAPVAGSNGEWTLFATIREPEHQLLLHGVHPGEVSADRRTEMALYLSRANFGLVIGAFEIDLDDGEVRFKTSIDVEGAELTDALIDHLVLANVSMMDRYLPGIDAVANGTPADAAIAAVES
jgi:hypothetical protein